MFPKRCKHCEIIGVAKYGKPKVKCFGCSKKYQTDIPLCIACWGDFHEIVLPICGSAQPRDMKKIYDAHINRKLSKS